MTTATQASANGIPTDELKDYVAVWEIQVTARNPQEAAQQARKCQLDTGNHNQFDVTDEAGEYTSVTLPPAK